MQDENSVVDIRSGSRVGPRATALGLRNNNSDNVVVQPVVQSKVVVGRVVAPQPRDVEAAEVVEEEVGSGDLNEMAREEDLVVDDDFMPLSPNDASVSTFQRLSLGGVDPVDAHDTANAQMVSEYVKDIVRVWKVNENKCVVVNTYMAHQLDITERMRGILVDWLVEVHLKFKLVPETLFICVNLIDRFLALKMVARVKLQLVGITALLVACKYEEIYPPELADFIYISDNAYSREEILKMEELLLNSLGFRVTVPSSLGFAQRWIKVIGRRHSKEFTHMTHYMLELASVDYNMLRHLPSKTAAAAVRAALLVFGSSDGDLSALTKHSGWAIEELDECVEEIVALVDKSVKSRLKAVRTKYRHTRFSEVARVAERCFHVEEEVVVENHE